ncbi:MAG TPA: LLM class flavin-dependent oxidoreductase [Pyrinomonadaceae bacterium]|nr:LLM class flavin-dependent oxidoreductase [Pyrinomonadaceae bacterium]
MRPPGRHFEAPAEAPARRPEVGLVLPQMEGAMAGETPRWPDLQAMARAAEAAGFDSLWVIDHLLLNARGEQARRKGVWECWSLLAALAATTSRVRLGSLVTATSLRHPAMLAKIVDTVDEISGGRLILGLGAGSYRSEHDAFGLPFDHPVGRFEEAVQIIRRLLRGEAVDFEGSYYTVRDCELRPRPARAAGPPVLIGTIRQGERMLRLVAEHADFWNAWLSFGRSDADQIPPLRAAVDAACRAAGRDPATLRRTASVLVDLTRGDFYGADVPMRLRDRQAVEPLAGTPAELAAAIRAFASEGVSHLQVSLAPNTLAGVEAFAEVLGLLGEGEAGPRPRGSAGVARAARALEAER